ncbi:MAG: tetratricopeptide repeat protein [Acidobacteria bacterium]|nr:tetratricopeptide repeat protein [Acidobacteriota bacterium]
MQFFVKPISIAAIILITANHSFAQDSIWVSYFGRGAQALEQGTYVEAEHMFRAAIDEAGKAAKSKNPNAIGMMSDSLSGLSAALRGQGKYADAESVVRKQLQLLEITYGERHPDYAKTLNNLGLLLSEQKKYKEAEEIHRRALKLREKYDEPPRRNMAVSLLNLGKIYYEQGKNSEAEALFSQARSIFVNIPREAIIPEDVDSLLMCEHNLALVYVEQKKYDEAEIRYKAVILLTEKLKGDMHPDLLLTLENYAKLLRLTNRPEQAVKLENRRKLILNNMQ